MNSIDKSNKSIIDEENETSEQLENADVQEAQQDHTEAPALLSSLQANDDPIEVLFEHASKLSGFRCNGSKYIRFMTGEQMIFESIHSKVFHNYMFQHYVKKQNGKVLPPNELTKLSKLLDIAAEDYPEEPMFIRVGEYDNSIFIDLGDDSFRAVQINPCLGNGWQVVEQPPVNFSRSKSMQALPEPVPGGDIKELREIINCPVDHDWTLLLGFLLSALSPPKAISPSRHSGRTGGSKKHFVAFCSQPHRPECRRIEVVVEQCG